MHQSPDGSINLARLDALLAGTIPAYSGPLSVTRFTHGQSNPTYLLETPTRKYVLRRKPSGHLLASAHAVDREYRVMRALHPAGYPVPEVFVYSEDAEIAETPFYVMAFVEGRIFRDARLPELSPEERAAVYDSANAALARLHTLDYAALGLADFGKSGNYFARQIARWSKQYKASETEPIPEMDRLIDWLPAHIPNPDDPTNALVHGDFGMHNLVFHPTEPRLIAVLDWEISTLGHPISDIFYHMLPWYTPDIHVYTTNFSDVDHAAYSIPTFDAYLNRYCERAGLPPVAHEQRAFYRAYTLFRAAGIVQGIVGRVVEGNAANPRARDMAALVRPLAQAAYREAQQAGMG